MTFAGPIPLDELSTKPERRPGDFDRDAKGTPWVAHPTDMVKPKRKDDTPRAKRVRYSRPSGYGELIQNTYNLQKWAERMIVAGFVLGLDDDTGRMLDEAPPVNDDDHTWRDFADTIARKAKERAKHMLAAERGTHAHELTELNDTERDPIVLLEAGEELGITSDVAERLLNAWRTMLDTHGMEVLATELAVVNDTYRCAGTLDRIVRLGKPLRFVLDGGEVVDLPAGMVVVLDLKTGKLRHDNGQVSFWSNYPIQIALYAGGVVYDPDTDTRTPFPWDVDQRWAIIAHLDVLAAIDGEEVCELILVDLEAGRRGADLVLAAKAYEAEAKFSLLGSCEVRGGRPDPHTHSKAFTTPGVQVYIPAPDEGADATEEQVAPLRGPYKAHKAWMDTMREEAIHAGADWHLSPTVRTLRRVRIVEGLLTLAAADANDDDVVKALVRHVTGSDAMQWPTLTTGAVVGTLNVTEAAAFVEACKAFVAGRYQLVMGDTPELREVA